MRLHPQTYENAWISISCGDEYYKEHADNARKVFSRETPDMQDGSDVVMARCLAFRESGAPLPFWNNPYQDGITFCIRTLARLVLMDEHEARERIGDLIKIGALIGDGKHYDIPDRKDYYRIPLDGECRVQLPWSVRKVVLAAGFCAHCGTTDRLSVDHIKPVAMGGSDDLSNLQCLCLSCNCSKRDRFIG